MNSPFFVLGLVGAGLCTAPVCGAITYLTQQRSVFAGGFVNGQPEGGSPSNAPNFGDFNRTRAWTFSHNTGNATGSQSSRLLPEAILFTGSAMMLAQPALDATMDGGSDSRLMVAIRLDSASAYRLEHSHTSSSSTALFGGRLAQARLTGATGTVFEWTEDLNRPSTWPASPLVGMLPAGDYSLSVLVSASRATSSGTGTSESSVSIAFLVPTPSSSALMLLIAGRTGSVRQRRR